MIRYFRVASLTCGNLLKERNSSLYKKNVAFNQSNSNTLTPLFNACISSRCMNSLNSNLVTDINVSCARQCRSFSTDGNYFS